MLKYRMEKVSPHHMNYVLVEAWYAFKVFVRNINREIFPTLQQIPRHVIPLSKYLLDPRLKKSEITNSTLLDVFRYK